MALESFSSEGVLRKRISKAKHFPSVNLISDSLIISNFTLLSTGPLFTSKTNS